MRRDEVDGEHPRHRFRRVAEQLERSPRRKIVVTQRVRKLAAAPESVDVDGACAAAARAVGPGITAGGAAQLPHDRYVRRAAQSRLNAANPSVPHTLRFCCSHVWYVSPSSQPSGICQMCSLCAVCAVALSVHG